jgi:hypothetical protein
MQKQGLDAALLKEARDALNTANRLAPGERRLAQLAVALATVERGG